MDILIKNIGLPTEDEQVNITILSDGSVIEHFKNEGGKWSSYRSGGVTAIELPEHGRLIDADALLPKSGYDPMMFKHKYDGDHRTQYDTLMGYEILGIVEDAPTVLEAST